MKTFIIKCKIDNKMKTFRIKCNEAENGRSIEQVIRECIANNTPIDNVVTPLYTEKKDGVLPETDIRTDRFEVAQAATDNLYKAQTAMRENLPPEQQNLED